MRAFLLQIDQLAKYTKEICSEIDLNELSYISKMAKFSMVFPVEKNEYVDYHEMMRCGLILKTDIFHLFKIVTLKLCFIMPLKVVI